MHCDYVMTTITIRNVPSAIHMALERRAEAHGRSLNKEILATLRGASAWWRTGLQPVAQRVMRG